MIYGFLLAGQPGSGKSLTGLSYHPLNATTTKRIVINMEGRIAAYRSEEYGVIDGTDSPDKLLFSCEIYPPEPEQISARTFIDLYAGIKSGKIKPDMVMIDNIVLFQDEFCGWCQTAADMTKLTDAANITAKFKMFLGYNFRVGEPMWWKCMKTVIREFLMDLRAKKIAFIGTTELKNVWENYGVKGKDAAGNQLQRIKGKSANLWDCWLQICDATWNLSRLDKNNELTVTPQIELDRFAPKSSIVGVPPTFRFKDWSQIWAWEQSRGIVNQEQLSELKAPETTYAEDRDDNNAPGEVPLGGTEIGKKAEEVIANNNAITWGKVMTSALLWDPKGALTGKAKAMRSIGKSADEAMLELEKLAGKSNGVLEPA